MGASPEVIEAAKANRTDILSDAGMIITCKDREYALTELLLLTLRL